MNIDIINGNANFLFDSDGVMIVTSITNGGAVVRGELIYDGKNTVILNRNNKNFYAFKNIAPVIREKIKNSEYVTIIEQNNDEMYSYDVIVHLVADLGIDDDWQEYQEKVAQELQSKLTDEEMEELLTQSKELLDALEK